jgi:hypothetical protein
VKVRAGWASPSVHATRLHYFKQDSWTSLCSYWQLPLVNTSRIPVVAERDQHTCCRTCLRHLTKGT